MTIVLANAFGVLSHHIVVREPSSLAWLTTQQPIAFLICSAHEKESEMIKG